MPVESKVIPNLQTYSGHSSEEVELYLRKDKTEKTAETASALNSDNNSALTKYRGYRLTDGVDTVQKIEAVPSGKRPIWFFYAGLGSQWPSCAKDMMKLNIFRESINRCADVLIPKGIDLIKLLTDSDESTFENIQNIFIVVAAVEVGLTDLLRHIGITPDGIFGMSLGELGCAYADDCFTTEQTMLAAYWRGQSILDTDVVPGIAAAIRLSWQEAIERVPEDVFVFSHNGENSVAVSGKIEAVIKFVEQFKAEGIRAVVFPTAGVPIHTKLLAEAGDKLRKSLNKVVPEPKKRSSRWLSTSIPPSEWDTPIAQYCSAEYLVNNLVSNIHLFEALQRIPQNSILIEIAPTGLLQIKPNQIHRDFGMPIGADITYLSLMRRNHPDNISFFLTSIGELYNTGAEPDIAKLYG